MVLVDHRVGESVEQDMYDIAVCKKESIAVYLGGLARAASALNSNVDARAVAQKALAQIIRVEGQANRISVLERRPFADLKKLFSDAQAKILCGFTPGEAQDAIVGYSRKIPVSSMTLHGDFIEGENMCTALGAVRDEDLMLLAVTYAVGSETRVIGTIVMPTDTAKRVLSAPVGVEFISKINVDILGQVVEVAKVLHSSSAIVAAEGDVYTYEMMALLHAIDPAKWPVVAGDEIDAMRAVKKRLVQLEAELGKCAGGQPSGVRLGAVRGASARRRGHGGRGAASYAATRRWPAATAGRRAQPGLGVSVPPLVPLHQERE